MPFFSRPSLVGECGLTFSAQSEMSAPGKNIRPGTGGIKSVKLERGGHRKISGLVDTREKPNRSRARWM